MKKILIILFVSILGFIVVFTFNGFGINSEEVIEQYNNNISNGMSTSTAYVSPTNYAAEVAKVYDNSSVSEKDKNGKKTLNLLWAFSESDNYEVQERDFGKKRPDETHCGEDITSDLNVPMYAVCDGTITKVSGEAPKKGFGGHSPYLTAADGSFTAIYGHAASLAKGLKVGSTVKKGDIIAYCGSEGASSGPHLHLEFYVDTNSTDFDAKVIKVRKVFDPLGDFVNYDRSKSKILSHGEGVE